MTKNKKIDPNPEGWVTLEDFLENVRFDKCIFCKRFLDVNEKWSYVCPRCKEEREIKSKEKTLIMAGLYELHRLGNLSFRPQERYQGRVVKTSVDKIVDEY